MDVLVVVHESDVTAGEVGNRLVHHGFKLNEHLVCPDRDDPTVGVPFPSVDNFDALLLLGSVRSLTEIDQLGSWPSEELELARAANACSMPTLGICFGGQVLAQALGGQVEVSPIPEIGWFDVTPTDPAKCPIDAGPWMQWHHDRFTAPAAAELLAHNETSQQLFKLGRSVGTQFHPEVDVSHVERWLAHCEDDYLRQHKVSPTELLTQTALHESANRERCHQFVDWFVESVVN